MSFNSDESEELVSDILLGLSLFCLLLSLVAILPNKKMVSLRSNRVHLMLILALILSIFCFFLMDLFVTDDSNDPSTSCSIIAFLLNYFWLCQLCWMVVEALAMYLALVQVFGTYISRGFLKYCLFGWGVPLIFPIIGVVWAGSSGSLSQFADPRTCFVRYPYGLASFYAPVVVGVSVNWIFFVFIARAIVSASKANVVTAFIDKKITQLKSFLTVSALLGLGWIVGFFLLMNDTFKNYSEINVVLRWIFIILNAPQGCFIFLFFVFWNADVRKFWLQRLKQLPLTSSQITGKTSVAASSSRKKSSAPSKKRGLAKTAKGHSVSDVNGN